jgi:excinuclease ABC subunit A
VMDKSWESASASKVENTWLSNIEITSKKWKSKSVPPFQRGMSEGQGDFQNGREIERFTDKMFCPNCNITYPEFTTQHFSPNRAEWACECCHWLWEILQVDFDKIIEPSSPLKDAILPWRDSNIWQAILRKLCEKYDQDLEKVWKDQPDWFLHVIVYWDNEELHLPIWSRIPVKWKWASFKYVWMEDVIKDQFEKGMLTVDFQAMLDMKPCPQCFWSKIKKESLHVFLTFPKKAVANIKKLPHFWESFLQQKNLPFTKPEDDWFEKINIWDLQKIPLEEMRELLQLYISSTTQPQQLIARITNPLLDRVQTIEDLWLGYLTTNRQIDTLSWWEIQRLRLAKQLWNKLTGIVYVLDEPTIWLDVKEIERTIQAIRKLKDMWNTIMVVEHNEEFIEASDRIVEIWPGAGDFGWELMFSW